MERTVVCLSVFVVLMSTSARAQDDVEVDRSRCTWRGARFGAQSQCAANEVAIGSCGSGADADCAEDEPGGEIWHELRCCELDDFRRTDCTTNKGFPGKRLSCPRIRRSDQYFVNAACGSALLFDCSFFTHSIDCCRGLLGDSWLGSSGVCYWKLGDSGERIECENDNEAVFGRCGSGGRADCGGAENFHGVQCCKLAAFPAGAAGGGGNRRTSVDPFGSLLGLFRISR